MKKFFFSLVMLMLTSTIGVFAQSTLVATLNHNDTISVFYGIDALVSAYSASKSGDVITLSSGGFNAPSTINKRVTIRGAGMERDTVNNVAPTILIGSFNIYSYEGTSTNSHLTMEGIWHDGTIFYGYSSSPYYGLEQAQFVKCRFNVFKSNTSTLFYLNNVKFIQCKIKGITALGNATFVNCYVRAPGKTNTSYKMYYECINCVVYGSLVDTHVNYSTFVNSVLLGNNPLDETNMVYNCVGVYTNSSDTINDLFTNIPVQLNNVCFRKKSAVFDMSTFKANHTDNYSDTDTYQLLDSIRTKYLGNDGKEVGMYGGSLPFNSQTTLPKIKKFTVASKSTADGKLNVEIEVSAPAE
ncbi:MAG: hypothetical protein IJY78_08485 [Bacteroidaceae bacterium]|nr:hypothetical protein [Bacteroidaceae bacterium]